MSRVAFTFLMIFPFTVQSQVRERVTQTTEWFGTSFAIKFTPKLGVFVDGQYRFVGAESSAQQVRLAFDYCLNDKFMITPVAATYNWNFLYGKQPASVVNNEIRIYQQFQYKHHAGKFFFTHRFRTEERLIQFHSGDAVNGFVDEGYDENFQFRIRHRVWCNYALTHDRLEPKTWFIASLAEAFMSWGERVTYTNKIDQVRLFVGPGYQFSRHGNIQIGPLYQYLVKRNGLQQENNVGFYPQLNYNLDLFSHSVK
jgi:hypothetical protein